MKDFDNRLNVAWWALKIGLGVGPIITGIDKYFNKLADWGMYLSPLATKVAPISATTFMHVVGAVEIVAGLIVLSRSTKLGSYIVMLWLIGIAVNLLTTGMFYDLAMRDVEIAVFVCAVATDGGARTACNRTTGSKSGGDFAALINPVTPVIPRCQTSWHQVLSSPERRRIYDFAAQVGIVTWGTAQDIR